MGFAIVNSAVSYVRLAHVLVPGFVLVPAPAPVRGGPELVRGELELEPEPEPEPELEPEPEPELEPEPEPELEPELELELEPEPELELELELELAPVPELEPAPAPEPFELVGSVGAVAYAYVEADTSALERDLELEHAAASDAAQQLAVLRQPVAQLVQEKASTEMDKLLGA
jgi:hypothetical protein